MRKGTVFYVMGKSAAGKDTVYRELKRRFPQLGSVVMYTTRPRRDGEQEGVQYFFRDREFLSRCRAEGRLIECRTYETACGPWDYFTVDDGQIKLENGRCYLMIGTLESYERMLAYYGEKALEPVYIEVEDGERLSRALERERRQREPKYKELCRRFLADEEDFKEENLRRCKITRRYDNMVLEECLEQIGERIRAGLEEGHEERI